MTVEANISIVIIAIYTNTQREKSDMYEEQRTEQGLYCTENSYQKHLNTFICRDFMTDGRISVKQSKIMLRKEELDFITRTYP